MLSIMIAEEIPSNNKGEATLLHGIYKTIKDACGDQVEFTLCSSSWDDDQRSYGEMLTVLRNPGMIHKIYGISKPKRILIRIYEIAKHFMFYVCVALLGKFSLKLFKDELWKSYLDSDVFLVGHDNSFSKYHLPLILFGKLLKKSVVIYGTTISLKVLDSSFFERFGRYCLNKVDLITTREPLTYEYLESIGVNKPPMFTTADKAFILKPINEKDIDDLIDKREVAKMDRPHIGVMLVKGSNVFKAAFTGQNMSVDERYDKHIKEIAKALDNLSDFVGGTIIFVPHVIGPHPEVDDRIVHRDVKERMTNKERTLLLEDDLQPYELKGLIGRFDMTISERTHGGIASATMNVPTLWISHPGDIRTYGIVGKTIGMQDCIYDIRDLDAKTLFQKMNWLWNSRKEVTRRLHSNIPVAKKLTMKNGEYFKEYIFDRLN